MRSLKRYLGGNGGTTSFSGSLAAIKAILLVKASPSLSSARRTKDTSNAAALLEGREGSRTNRILDLSHVQWPENTTQHSDPGIGYCYKYGHEGQDVRQTTVGTS